MNLEKILTISGKPGLYQLQNQTRNGFLATSLIDGKKISVSARQNVSILSEIAIYTLTKELPLSEVFTKIHKKEHPFFLMKGKMSILTENGVKHIQAPHHGITKPGTKRII